MFQPNCINARHESRGETTADSGGTGVSGNATKGTWVNLGSTTSFTYEAITVAMGSVPVAQDHIVDIGITDGTNTFIIVEDLHYSGLRLAWEAGVTVYIPVHVPAGSQLQARTRGTGAQAVDVLVIGHSAGLGGTPGFSRCIALFTSASSRGIAIDPGGTANTKGTWTQMTSSCPATIGAMLGLIGYNGDIGRAATATALVDIGLGASGNESVLYPNALVGWGATRDGPSICPRIPIFACQVASGTRIAARASCSINTAGDRTLDLALYGLVL